MWLWRGSTPIFHAFSISRLSEAIVFWSSCDSFSAVCTLAAFATISWCGTARTQTTREQSDAREAREKKRGRHAVSDLTKNQWNRRAHLVELTALFDQPLLRFVRLFQCPMQLVVLLPETLEGLVAHELLQDLS